MRFGLPNLDQSISDSQFFVRELKNKPEKHLRAYASLFISHLCEPGDPSATTFEDGVPKEGLNVGQLLTRIGIISLIKRKVFEYQDKHGLVSFQLPKKLPPPVESLPEQSHEQTPKQENGESNSNELESAVKDEVKMEDSSESEVKTENDSEKPVNETESGEKMEVDEVSVKVETKEENKETDKEEEKETEKDQKDEKDMEVDKVKPESEESESKEVAESNSIENDDSQQSTVKSEPSKEETNGTQVKEEVKEEKEEEPLIVKEFDFNIQDGGLTELQTLWYFEDNELKPKHEHEIWNRRHDYWMLAGIVKHGYEQWEGIANDEDFAILNEPFKTTLSLRNKFMERRLRLLEQALVFEEQLRRYSHLSSLEVRVPKPKEEKDDSKESDDNSAEQGQSNGDDKNGDDETKEKKQENGEAKKENGDIEDKENDDLIINPNIQRAANQLEDLLIDMKSDCARIPQTVQRIPSIANRLQIGPRNVANPNVPLTGMPQMMNRMM